MSEMQAFTPLQARSPKSQHQRSPAPSEVSRGDFILASYSFLWLHVFLGLRLHLSSLSLYSQGLLSASISYKDTCGWV